MAILRKKQQADEQLLAPQQKYLEQYINIHVNDDVDNIICYVKLGNPAIQSMIVLPAVILDSTGELHSHHDGTSE